MVNKHKTINTGKCFLPKWILVSPEAVGSGEDVTGCDKHSATIRVNSSVLKRGRKYLKEILNFLKLNLQKYPVVNIVGGNNLSKINLYWLKISFINFLKLDWRITEASKIGSDVINIWYEHSKRDTVKYL